jgi:hypothetical protein
MKFVLVLVCSILSFSASAQWLHLHISFKKKHAVLPLLSNVKGCPPDHIDAKLITASTFDLQPHQYEQTRFSLEAQTIQMIKMAKHNMSWRIYNLASYNFSDLAELYIKLHRLSEAKWYLLQSNNISREENDDKHTIANLIDLALVKNRIGDNVSARADLVEAQALATNRGMKEKVDEINKKILLLDQIKPAPTTKYAETTETQKKDL